MIALAQTTAALPPAELVAAVRAGHWQEVSTLAAALAPPLPPAVALVAARAERAQGQAGKALALLRQALPRAGELAPALRLEAARAATQAGSDPLPFVQPLVQRATPSGQRHAAADIVRDGAGTLPTSLVRGWLRRGLPRGLRREVAAELALRGRDVAAASRLLAERGDDAAALRVALWLAGESNVPVSVRLAAASALLAGGHWREADALLAAMPRPSATAERFRLAFLRGRAAYRLGRLADAATFFSAALDLAPAGAARFEAAVQRARTAELAGDLPTALSFWDAARTAAPREVEGWDGGARCRAALGHAAEAAALVLRAPPGVQRVAGPRLVALLLSRGELDPAEKVLRRLPASLAVVRMLDVALAAKRGNIDTARARAAALLADKRGGQWRELVLDLLPPSGGVAPALPSTRQVDALARYAASWGVAGARDALLRALAADPEWAAALAGATTAPAALPEPVAALVGVGLEADAAELFASRFPSSTVLDLAWSARTLAAWGNGSAALTAGERLWERLGGVPACLVPERVLALVLPPPLVADCARAASAEGVPPDWVVAVVRQESRFDARARSAAGAVGIAQLVPETARRLGVAPEQAWEPDTALTLAARELKALRGTLGERLGPVAAAYNAGEAVTRTWLAASGGSAEEPLFAAFVPYRETAGYVLAVREGVELARPLHGVTPPATQRADGQGGSPPPSPPRR